LIPPDREPVERLQSLIKVCLRRTRLFRIRGDHGWTYKNKTLSRFLLDLKAAITKSLGQGTKSLRIGSAFFYGSVPGQPSKAHDSRPADFPGGFVSNHPRQAWDRLPRQALYRRVVGRAEVCQGRRRI